MPILGGGIGGSGFLPPALVQQPGPLVVDQQILQEAQQQEALRRQRETTAAPQASNPDGQQSGNQGPGAGQGQPQGRRLLAEPSSSFVAQVIGQSFGADQSSVSARSAASAYQGAQLGTQLRTVSGDDDIGAGPSRLDIRV